MKSVLSIHEIFVCINLHFEVFKLPSFECLCRSLYTAHHFENALAIVLLAK